MRKRFLTTIALAGVAALTLAACSSNAASTSTTSASAAAGTKAAASGTITVGFAQTGSESGWRSANTDSMKAAFSEANGFKLVFNAADNDPAAQIAAVRSFINQKVDAIVIAPIVSAGWDDVLKEAKAAKIPVILEDRTVEASADLYAAWVGDNFKAEGEAAGKWAAKEFTGKPANMVVLEGTTGSSAANDRTTGFATGITGSSIKKVDSQTGDFTRDGGKKVMEGFISKYGIKGIDLVFAQNDDMALGAIEAIEAAGAKPGVDIKIVSIDGVHDGMQALSDGKINYIVECNPLLGDQAAQLVKDVIAKKTVAKQTYGVDGAFDKAAATAALPTRKY
jgi:simple sugar transport system substrate-binding protein